MKPLTIIRYLEAPVLEATWADETRTTRCEVFHGSQLDLLRAALTAEQLIEFKDIIEQCEADYVPAQPPSLLSVQQAQIAELSRSCEKHIYAGFESSALGVVHRYPAKDKDQANLSGSIIESLMPSSAEGWTTLFWCADLDNNWEMRPHTAAQIQLVGRDSKAAILDAVSKNIILASQVMSGTTAEEIQAVVWA